MRRRLGLLAAALIVASLWIVPWLLVAHVAEKPAGPSYTPTGCTDGDRACQEWIDIQGPKEGR